MLLKSKRHFTPDIIKLVKKPPEKATSSVYVLTKQQYIRQTQNNFNLPCFASAHVCNGKRETSGFRVLLISKKHPAVAEHKLNTDEAFDNTHFV